MNEFGCFIYFVFLGIVAIYSHLSREETSKIWQKFAEINNLTFTSHNFFNNAKIMGQYKGFQLTLELHYEGKQAYTYISLQSDTIFRTTENEFNKNKSSTEIAQDTVDNLLKIGIFQVPGQFISENGGKKIIYREIGVITSLNHMQYISDLLLELRKGYGSIVKMGGEVVPSLLKITSQSSNPLHKLAKNMLSDIGYTTRIKFSHQADHLLCPQCLTRFDRYQIRLSRWESMVYYGCRTCGQSETFIKGEFVAVLDKYMPTETIAYKQNFRINWLAKRSLFDFDSIEIIQANDEDVERFAMQIGNDTDPTRIHTYKHKLCTVHSTCNLSQNTLRILQRTFNGVKYINSELNNATTNKQQKTKHLSLTIDY